MIRHLFRLVWNRRRANALVFLEIMMCFLVLCGVLSVAAHYLVMWSRPLGFQHDSVVAVYADPGRSGQGDPELTGQLLTTARGIHAALNAEPEVVAAAAVQNVPYASSTSLRGVYTETGLLQFLWGATTPELKQVLRLQPTAGRWLEPADAELEWNAVVIDRRLALRLFGDDDPVGRDIPQFTEQGEQRSLQPHQVLRVVGVVNDFRKDGELSDSPYAAFTPFRLDDPERSWVPRSWLLRLADGTPAIYEQQLLESLARLAPDWSFQIEPLSVARRRVLRQRLVPLAVGVVVAGFLIITAGLGLVGVLWQTVIRRTEEIGVRRAFGATGLEVRWQVLGELLALTALAVAVGSAVFLQFPVLGLVPSVELTVYLAGLGAAILGMLSFVVFCGLYPSSLATRVHPAQALQYE